MLWSCRIPQAKPDWAGSIAGVKIPRESRVLQVLLAEQSGLLPSILHECVEAVLGGTALQEMFAFRPDGARFLAVSEEPCLCKRSGVKLGVLVMFRERELLSASTDTAVYTRSITNTVSLPQVLFVAGKDHPRARYSDWVLQEARGAAVNELKADPLPFWSPFTTKREGCQTLAESCFWTDKSIWI